jgi:hypothetical protein
VSLGNILCSALIGSGGLLFAQYAIKLDEWLLHCAIHFASERRQMPANLCEAACRVAVATAVKKRPDPVHGPAFLALMLLDQFVRNRAVKRVKRRKFLYIRFTGFRKHLADFAEFYSHHELRLFR